MSLAHLPAPPLTVDLAEAAGRDEMVIFHCLGCSRSREARATVFLAFLGAIPFGMLVGKLKCTRCRGVLAVLLPWYAPTPAAWVKQYRPQLEPVPEPPAAHVFNYTLEQLDDFDNVVQVRTASVNFEHVRLAFEFDIATSKLGPYRISNRARIVADSRRDFKVVNP
ncbi:MAG: hypothetical protein ISS15_05255 [Alphaproteobacteria bacterium]|nr:hypothetical protein [Alphaproteobacteria bacterium]MBL6939473.1 hypothetical protein [Alphaproteobacteria bacterium]MBL7097046.1 hypothetical protein [Alphaproteobacteria bacterium]